MAIALKPTRTPVIAVLITLAGLGVPFTPLMALGEAVPTFEFPVPPLMSEQPLLKSIRVWNNDIVVESEVDDESTRRSMSRYHVVDLKTNVLHSLVIAGCKTINSIAESAKVAFALCRNDQQPVLLSTVKGAMSGWQTQPLPVDMPAEDDLVLVASDNHLALLSSEDLYWRTSDGGWQRTLIPHPNSVEGKGPPQHALLTNGNLFLGYNRGEFGGGLVYIPAAAHSTNPLGPTKLLSLMNVEGIVMDRAGTVWVAGGLRHMGIRRADLVMVKDGAVKTILNEETFGKGKQSRSGSLQLPGSTDVSGLCLDPTEKPLILATDLGVFEVGNTNLTYRIRASFYISYEMPGYSVGSSPVGMACTADRSILVATRSTGILTFVKKVNGYDFRQIIFPD